MKVGVETLRLEVDDPLVDHVDAAVHTPTRPTGPALLLAPGAGGSLDTAGLVALADAVAAEGTVVVRANLPYRQAGRARPPRAEASVDGYAAVLSAARREVAPRRAWVAGGKSYGGRVASLLAARGDADVVGLVLYGYPLHPPGRPERLRVDHWRDVSVPCLFLQGDRDTFCDPALLDAHLGRLARPATVHVVPGGDHSLRVTRAASPDGVARNERVVVGGLGPAVAAFVRGLDG